MDRKNALTDSRSRARLYLVILLVGLGGVVAILPPFSPQHSASNAAKPDGRQVAAKAKKPSKGDLVRAVIRGDEQDVRKLLALGADVNENVGKDDAPITPLFAAMAMDEEKIARILISHGADLQREYLGYTAADLANYWGQENLERRLASETSGVQKENKAALNIDGAVWVANGLAALSENKDEGTALGLAYIIAIYERPATQRGVNRNKVLQQANRLREECQKTLKARKSDSVALTELADIAFRNLEDKNVAAHVAHATLGGRTGLIEQPPIGPSFSILRNIVQQEMDRNRFHERTLEIAYWLGTKEKDNAGWVINEFASKTLTASLTNKADEIVAGNANRFRPAVLTILRSDVAHNKEDIRKSWEILFKEIHQGTLARIEILNRMDSAERAAIKQEETRQTFEALYASVYLLKTVASFSDSKLAHQIEIIGTAVIQIGKSISTFLMAGATTIASCVTLVGGIVVGVMTIASLFDYGPSTEKIISHQITELRQEVENLREEMHARFDALDRRLNDMYDLLVRGFNSLTIDLALCRLELRSVAAQISLMESHLLGLESNIRDYLEVGIDRSVWRQVARCQEWKKYHQDPLPYAEFALALDTLLQAATREARDVLAAGRELRDEELNDPSKLAAQFLALTEGGLDRSVGILQSIARQFDPNGRFGKMQLGNPMRWAMMAEAYMQLASLYPDYYKRIKVAGIDKMLHFGEEWQAAVQSLKTANSSRTFYIRLLENYKLKAGLFSSIVSERVQKYQAENVEGYDLWAGPHQAPRSRIKRNPFGISEIRAREPFTGPKGSEATFYNVPLKHWKNKNFSAPTVLANQDSAKKLFDPALLIAHHLGVGQIAICWDNPGGDDERHLPGKDVGYKGVFVKPALTLKGDFIVDGRRTRALFRIRLRSDDTMQVGAIGDPQQRKGMLTISWTNGNFDGPGKFPKPEHRIILEEQLNRHWPTMRERAFKGENNNLIRRNYLDATVNAAAQAVDAYFKSKRDRLEQELRVGVKGSDGDLSRAMTQLTAAKAILDAFVSLGMAKSLTENAKLDGMNQGLHDLLAGARMDKGQTRLLDRHMIEAITAKGRTLPEITRDKGWLDSPANKLEEYFKKMPDSPEPQPLIESTMERLMLLKKMHESAQPKGKLPKAARELKRSVKNLRQQ